VTRENWLAYGNPDGPQQREDVVAIPKWVIEGKNSGWILGVYGALFGMLLPYLVVRPSSSLSSYVARELQLIFEHVLRLPFIPV
jgi:translocation protein SEC63